MAGGTTIVDRLNKLSGKDATTIPKALEYLEEEGVGGDADWNINDPEAKGYISNRPFYEYDSYDSEEVFDFVEYYSGKQLYGFEFTKYSDDLGISYNAAPYFKMSDKSKILYRDIFEQDAEYKIVLTFDSDILPTYEFQFAPASYPDAPANYLSHVEIKTDDGSYSKFYGTRGPGVYYTVAACKFYVAGTADEEDTIYPDKITFTGLKAYKKVPVKKVKKIDEKYLPSSGAEVSKIKIATANGGLSMIDSSTNMAFFTGGGSVDDGATVADKIGDKTIVGFACNIHTTNPSGTTTTHAFEGIVNYSGNLALNTRTELAEIKGFTVYGWTISSNTGNATVDVYAICI